MDETRVRREETGWKHNGRGKGGLRNTIVEERGDQGLSLKQSGEREERWREADGGMGGGVKKWKVGINEQQLKESFWGVKRLQKELRPQIKCLRRF